MTFEKNMVDLSELIVMRGGKIQVGRKTYVVGCNLGCLFNLSHPSYLIYLWY